MRKDEYGEQLFQAEKNDCDDREAGVGLACVKS